MNDEPCTAKNPQWCCSYKPVPVAQEAEQSAEIQVESEQD